MVVIHRLESRIVTKNDSTEDLLIIPLSDTESVDEVYTPPPPIINQRSRNGGLFMLSVTPCTKHGGRRKRRQFENLVDLLSKGPIEVHIPTIEDFFPCSQRSLISLLEESSFYEAFIYGCEDLFDRLEGQKSVHKNNNHWKLKSDKESASSALCISVDSCEKKALARVDESVRLAVVNGTVPQDLVRKLEAKVVDFFCNNPTDIFVSRGLSPLERTALVAICSFHQLTYKCFRKRRYHIAQVMNSNFLFQEPLLHLSNILSKCLGSNSCEQLKN